MTRLDPTITVATLVADRPGRSRIFERLGIEYCCGGKKPLAEVCRSKGLDAWTLLQTLVAAEDPIPQTGGPDPSDMPLGELADHIERVHHDYLRRQLPRLARLIQNVVDAHAAKHPWLLELRETFGHFAVEMELHMAKEEQTIFPAIRRLESEAAEGDCGCGGLSHPLTDMEHDHDEAGHALAKMRELTWGYTPPQDASNAFRALLEGLRALETDLHQHVHKENNILFPRAMELEESIYFPPVPQL
jgi:regulator of cell morphogenesis and NO signaling